MKQYMVLVAVLVVVTGCNKLSDEAQTVAVATTLREICLEKDRWPSHRFVRVHGKYVFTLHGNGIVPHEGAFPIEYQGKSYDCAAVVSFPDSGSYSGTAFAKQMVSNGSCDGASASGTDCGVVLDGYIETVASVKQKNWLNFNEEVGGYGHMSRLFMKMRVERFAFEPAK